MFSYLRTDMRRDSHFHLTMKRMLSSDSACTLLVVVKFVSTQARVARHRGQIPQNIKQERSSRTPRISDERAKSSSGSRKIKNDSLTNHIHDDESLPEPWKPLTSSSGDVFYFNSITGERRWEPPQTSGLSETILSFLLLTSRTLGKEVSHDTSKDVDLKRKRHDSLIQQTPSKKIKTDDGIPSFSYLFLMSRAETTSISVAAHDENQLDPSSRIEPDSTEDIPVAETTASKVVVKTREMLLQYSEDVMEVELENKSVEPEGVDSFPENSDHADFDDIYEYRASFLQQDLPIRPNVYLVPQSHYLRVVVN